MDYRGLIRIIQAYNVIRYSATILYNIISYIVNVFLNGQGRYAICFENFAIYEGQTSKMSIITIHKIYGILLIFYR